MIYFNFILYIHDIFILIRENLFKMHFKFIYHQLFIYFYINHQNFQNSIFYYIFLFIINIYYITLNHIIIDIIIINYLFFIIYYHFY